jgi:hypothetical protein
MQDFIAQSELLLKFHAPLEHISQIPSKPYASNAQKDISATLLHLAYQHLLFARKESIAQLGLGLLQHVLQVNIILMKVLTKWNIA